MPHIGKPASTDQTGSKCLSHTHIHKQMHVWTTSGMPDCPTCPFMDLQWIMDQCLVVCPEAEKKKKAKWKSHQNKSNSYLQFFFFFVLPREPYATHKIQLGKTRDLYSWLTTATHTNICRVQNHLLLQTAQSARCVHGSVWMPQIFLLNINHCLPNECVSVCVCVWFLTVCAACGWECSLSENRNVSQQKSSALS